MRNANDLIEKIGIDKTVITNFTINTLDIKYLKSIKVDIITDDNSLLKTNDNIGIRILKLTDSYFGKLECGMTNANPKKIYMAYTKLTLSVSNYDNLQNLSVCEYKQRINQVFKYIKDKYKIDIIYDFQTLSISYMEINATFKLNEDFYNYKRALLILMINLPINKYSYKNNHTIKYKSFYEVNQNLNTAKLETLWVKNSSIELIIYNKTKQLKDIKNIVLENDYIRIEYKLKRKDSYIKVLGSTVGNLTDKKIKQFYINCIENDIFKPYENYKYKIKDIFESVLKPMLEHSERQWYRDFIRIVREYEQKNILPMIIDIEDIFPILKSYSKGNYSRCKKMVLRKANESERDLLGVTEKINEIINKLKSFSE